MQIRVLLGLFKNTGVAEMEQHLFSKQKYEGSSPSVSMGCGVIESIEGFDPLGLGLNPSSPVHGDRGVIGEHRILWISGNGFKSRRSPHRPDNSIGRMLDSDSSR